MFGDPALGRAGNANEQQRAIRRERGHRDFDAAFVAEILGRDRRAIGQLATEHVAGDRPRRKFPVRGALAVILQRERRELGGEQVFRRFAEQVSGSGGCVGHKF